MPNKTSLGNDKDPNLNIQKQFFYKISSPSTVDSWLTDINIDNYLKIAKNKSSVFTFTSRSPNKKYPLKFKELDQMAAIPLTTYENWWSNQLHRKTRNMIRKAQKSDIEIIIKKFDDELLQDIFRIYNETPIRQNKPFRHYKVPIEKIKDDYLKLIDSLPNDYDFLVAKYNNETIAFIHLLYSDELSFLSQIIGLQQFFDKSAINLLIAKSVEICCSKNVKYLMYAKMSEDSLGFFKQRNGFEKISLEKYYIPLNLIGKVVCRIKLYNHYNRYYRLKMRIKNKIKLYINK